MFITSFWVKTRLNIIFSILLDVILFLIYLFKLVQNNFSSFTFIFNLSFLVAWVVISYVLGRYHRDHSGILGSLKNIFFSLLNIFIYFSFSYLLVFNILNLKDNLIYESNFLFFIKYIFSSYFIQYFLQKFFKNKFKYYKDWHVLGSNSFFDKLVQLIGERKIKLNSNSIDEIIFDKNNHKENIIIEDFSNFSGDYQKEILNLHFKGANIFSVINWCEIVLQRIPLLFLSSDEFLNFFSKVNRGKSFQIRLKRAADILLSIFLIFCTLPLITLFSLFIYLEDRGPVLYFQNRVGKNGVNFRICKLRSMNINAESSGVQWASKNDVRVTNVGKLLRSTRIDELPQLFSVLIGDMSLIGPRPERPEIDKILKDKIPFYELRYLIKPGLSGWAQVNYPYGSSIKDSETKLTFDFFYIKNFSFWLDLLIFFRTIRLVSRREGSYPNR